MYRPWSLAFQDTTIWCGMCLTSVIGSASARRMVSMVSCNSVTTLTLGLASRTIDTDVIILPRMSLSHLQSYLSLASFILNFYVSCGCWLTCRLSSTSISLVTKRTSGMSVSSGVGSHSAILVIVIGMRLALLLHTLQPQSVHISRPPLLDAPSLSALFCHQQLPHVPVAGGRAAGPRPGSDGKPAPCALRSGA